MLKEFREEVLREVHDLETSGRLGIRKNGKKSSYMLLLAWYVKRYPIIRMEMYYMSETQSRPPETG